MTITGDAGALEAVFHKALSEGDAKGVDAALRLLALADPRRAQRLYDALRDALEIRAARDTTDREFTVTPTDAPLFDQTAAEHRDYLLKILATPPPTCADIIGGSP